MRINKTKPLVSETALKTCKTILGKLGFLVSRSQSPTNEELFLQITCLFDQPFYEQQCGRSFDEKLDAIQHYLSTGSNSNHYPNPLFDNQYYLSKNPDVAESCMNPLVHFVCFGAQERRNPHKCFDINYYLAQISEQTDSKVNALEHFLLNSVDNHAINPNPNFSVKEYYQQNPDALFAKDNALVHSLYKQKEKPAQNHVAVTKEILPDYNRKHKGVPGIEKLILCSHDASRTGAPLIILKIAELLHTKHHINCKIILIRGGPLVAEFRKHGEVTVLDTSTNHRDRNFLAMRLKIAKLIDVNSNYALCNSAESHLVIKELAKHGLKILSLIHEFMDTYPQTVIENLYRNSSKIILPADIVLRSLQSRFDQKLTAVEVLPQGIFADRDYTQPAFDTPRRQKAKQQILTELELSETTKIVLGSGYVDNRKGCDYFMLTCQTIQTRYPELDFAFIWVGQKNASFADASFDFWLTSDQGKTNLENHLFFVGEKEDPTDFFLAADVFFMCSRLDPFPCVVLEALSAATPVVCFDNTTGSTELLESGAGTIVAPFHLLEAADAIASYLKNDSLRMEAGMIGQGLIKTNFQFTNYVDALVHRLEEIGFEHPIIGSHEQSAPP
jgi:glycosyltransferase involved in cell wall biosynthesis